MASLDAGNVDKPVEHIHSGKILGASIIDIERTLETIVRSTREKDEGSDEFVHGPINKIATTPLVKKSLPGVEKLVEQYACGTFVLMRGETTPFFEPMPLFARLGIDLQMSLEKASEEDQDRIKTTLARISKKQGEIFDDPESRYAIPSFIKAYSIHTDDLLHPEVKWYPNFNAFFSRQFKPGARPIQNEDDPFQITSLADSRLTVYPSVQVAQEFWIKGRNFTTACLLDVPPHSPKLLKFQDAGLAVFRLAFADSHTFYSPIDGIVKEIHDVPGEYFSTKPQVVNEPNIDVLTSNKRSVLYLTHIPTGLPVAIVAIGSLLVGSISWSQDVCNEGTRLERGDELGHFAYGGSTVVAVFPKLLVEFDQDLVTNSEKPIETLIKVGYSVGKTLIRE